MLDLASMLEALNRLKGSTLPLWGEMTAQEMVEHLSDLLVMSQGKGNFVTDADLETQERRQKFLFSDKEMAKNVAIPFKIKTSELRNDELELAVDEFTNEWLNFIEFYEINPKAERIHPYYGNLNELKWMKLHEKHIIHHFKQFGLIQ